MSSLQKQLQQKLCQQLTVIYEAIKLSKNIPELADELITLMRLDKVIHPAEPHKNHWSQKDAVLITYGDSVIEEAVKPLQTLDKFIDQYLGESFNSVHILPFFPFSSDDGFAVIDYSSVNESLGDWNDITTIAKKRRLMSDLVINHCSSRSYWFQNFIKGESPGKDYFFTGSPSDDHSQVIRPRTTPLLRETKTVNGTEFVWCTFSHDQVDFDFSNPEVLKVFVSIIRQYLDMGIRIFRLDAVAFLWKVVGTYCLNLPQTHEVIRLLRTLIEHAQPDAVIITETNIPNIQNLAYFGNANEAHCIYNFSLPPLLVNTLITGSSVHLKRWLMSMPPAQSGTAYFNFIASHDGIGLRPAEGLLSTEELGILCNTMSDFGGRVSWRTTEDGQQKAYEINITLFDALSGTVKGLDALGIDRFICAHAIMLGLEGIPGIYIHSMIGTGNDYEKVKNTHQNRSINRRRWHYNELESELAIEQTQHAKVLKRMNELLEIRCRQRAFHPNATQFTLHLGPDLFGFWRQSIDRMQSIFCISNVTAQHIKLRTAELNLIITDQWHDLLSGVKIDDTTEEMELKPYQTVWIGNM